MASAASENGPVACFQQAELVGREEAWPGAVLLSLRAHQIARAARPGQFVMVGPLDPVSCDPFLNRPYSVHGRPQESVIQLLVGVVGRGSGLLAGLLPAERIGLLGPLGRGFAVPDGCELVLALGGGLGVAPLVFLAAEQAASGRRVCLVHGARTAGLLCDFPALDRAGVDVQRATDDGSYGFRGTAVARRRQLLDAGAGREKAYLAACGPRAMLAAAARLASVRGLTCEVALEGRMACGVGACLGCTEELHGGRQARLCREGPVFPAGEVFGP